MRAGLIAVLVVFFMFAASVSADAAWVTHKKKKVSAWDGARNSVNGALRDAMPWNWGRRD